MSDIETRLRNLADRPSPTAAPSDQLIAADLHRATTARRRRRTRRVGVSAVGVCAVAAATAVAVVGTGGTTDRAPSASRVAAPRATHQRPAAGHTTGHTTVQHPSTAHPSTQQLVTMRLVSYDGPQQPGFTVRTVPDGYVLQGVSGSTLDIAPADDHTSLDTFVGKLTVGIEQETGDLNGYHGTPVTVNGHDGLLVDQGDGIMDVVYEQGGGSGNIVTVQKWGNIALTDDQLVRFADGITVEPGAQRQHG